MSSAGTPPGDAPTHPEEPSDDLGGAILPSPPPPWSFGTFAAELTRLIRRLEVWHVADFQRPLQSVRSTENYWQLTSRTFRDAIEGFDDRPYRTGIRLFTRGDGQLGGCEMPELLTDRSATLWLLATFCRRLESAPPADAFDYLRGLIGQLLAVPTWETQTAGEIGFYGPPEDTPFIVGRPIPEALLKDLDRTAGRLLDVGDADRSRANPPDPRRTDAGRHLVFRALRRKFEEAAKHFPDFRIYPMKLDDSEGLVRPEVLSAAIRSMTRGTHGGCGGWMIINGGEREVVEAAGPGEAFRLWEQLATEAGASLGDEHHRPRPVLPFSETRVFSASPAGLWSNFVFNTLKDAGGMHVGIRMREDQRPLRQVPAAIQRGRGAEIDDGPALATYAVTATGIFSAAALAIDFAGLGEPISPANPTMANSGRVRRPKQRKAARQRGRPPADPKWANVANALVVSHRRANGGIDFKGLLAAMREHMGQKEADDAKVTLSAVKAHFERLRKREKYAEKSKGA